MINRSDVSRSSCMSAQSSSSFRLNSTGSKAGTLTRIPEGGGALFRKNKAFDPEASAQPYLYRLQLRPIKALLRISFLLSG